jgi:hypothetical protein
MEKPVLKKGTILAYNGGEATYELLEDVINPKSTSMVKIKLISNPTRTYLTALRGLRIVDTAVAKEMNNAIRVYENFKKYGIERIIYNDPATIVYFTDGTKEVVKVSSTDTFDHRQGVLLCIIKHLIKDEDVYRLIKKDMFKEIDRALPKGE